MQREIMFGSRVVIFNLEYRRRKSLGIKVHPNSQVEVLAPLDVKEITVLEKVRRKVPWILKQMDHFNSFKPSTPKRRFVNGETHLYLGRQYRLKVVSDKDDNIKAYRGQLLMHAKNPHPDKLRKQLDKWYKERATIIFTEALQELLPKFRRYNIKVPILTIRTMLKRWGSCTPTGRVILNTELVKASKGCIEYVIIHELCHLVHHNHTKAFQTLLTKMMPDWRKMKLRLESTPV